MLCSTGVKMDLSMVYMIYCFLISVIMKSSVSLTIFVFFSVTPKTSCYKNNKSLLWSLGMIEEEYHINT